MAASLVTGRLFFLCSYGAPARKPMIKRWSASYFLDWLTLEMAANSANRPFDRKSVAAAAEPAKFKAVKPQCHSKSRLLQKETWSGRFLLACFSLGLRPLPFRCIFYAVTRFRLVPVNAG